MFGIFKVIKLTNKLRKGVNDPNGFIKEEVNDTLLGVFIVSFIVNIFFATLFFIVGYTDLFGFSWWIGKLLFVLSLFGLFTLFFLLRTIRRFVKSRIIETKISVVSKDISNN